MNIFELSFLLYFLESYYCAELNIILADLREANITIVPELSLVMHHQRSLH